MLCFSLVACVSRDHSVERELGYDSAKRQILVMLRVTPPHFRPEANYANGYDSRSEQHAWRRMAEELANKHSLKVVAEWPMPALAVDCFVMQAAADDSIARLVERLSQDPRVESVQAMNLFHMLGHKDPLYSLQPSAKLWHLAELHKLTMGRNIRVAEIDTGVEFDHPDLRDQVILNKNFVDGNPYAPEMHGTAIAGIIAAHADNDLGIVGIAPQAKLIVLRACWQESSDHDADVCSSFTLAKALQFALNQNVQIINLSLGGPRDKLLERLLDVALADDITIVSAVDPQVSDGGFPASHTGVLAVASDDALVDRADVLLAPGRDIPTTILGGRWNFVAGSSFAAAHVSGLAALLRELAPQIKPGQMRDALVSASASGITSIHSRSIDACAAVTRVAGTCACRCAMTQTSSMLHH